MCKTAEIVLEYYCTNYAGIVLISRKFIMVFTVDPLKKTTTQVSTVDGEKTETFLSLSGSLIIT